MGGTLFQESKLRKGDSLTAMLSFGEGLTKISVFLGFKVSRFLGLGPSGGVHWLLDLSPFRTQ